MLWSLFKKLAANANRVKYLARDFLSQRISAAGVSYIVTERSRFRRYVWLTCVIGCVVFMGYMTTKVMSEYMKYPKMLIKEDVIMPKLPFPAVTVCSLNPISARYTEMTTLKKHIMLRKLLDNAKQLPTRSEDKLECIKYPLCKWSWFLETCVCEKNPCSTEFCIPNNETHCLCSSVICGSPMLACHVIPGVPLPWSMNACLCETDNEYRPITRENEVTVDDVIARIEDAEVQDIVKLVWKSQSFDLTDVEEGLMPTVDEIYEYGINLDNLVASCSFETNDCHMNNFTVLYHPKYGKCYMFNYVGGQSDHQKQPLDTHNYGSNSGLRLLLRVTDQESLDLVRREVGARIVIHDPYELPFVAEYGVNVRPLDMTAVGVSMSTMQKLSYPWGDCVEDNQIRREPYTILGCEKKCSLDYMTEQCQCAMRNFLHGSVLSKKTTRYPLCDITDPWQMQCVSRVTEQLEKRNVRCDCKPACNETTFSYTITSSELNANFYRTVKAIRTMFPDPDGSLSFVNAIDQKSMIGVKVYYATFQVSKQSEVASYSWETLIANIGGNLGFFMGLTLITFVEIAEFFWDVMTAACKPPSDNKVYANPSALKMCYLKETALQRSSSAFGEKKVDPELPDLSRRRSGPLSTEKFYLKLSKAKLPEENVNVIFCKTLNL